MDDSTISKIKDVMGQQGLPLIRAAVIGGSCASPFIDSPHDVDLVLYVDLPTSRECFGYVQGLREKMSDIAPGVSIIVHTYSMYPYPSFIRKRDKNGHINRVWAWQIPRYCIDIVGDISAAIPDDELNLLTHEDEYMEKMRDYYLSDAFRKAMGKSASGRVKSLYYGLLTLYFIDNDAYELTDEQRRNVNIAHDCADGWEELYEWLIKRIGG